MNTNFVYHSDLLTPLNIYCRCVVAELLDGSAAVNVELFGVVVDDEDDDGSVDVVDAFEVEAVAVDSFCLVTAALVRASAAALAEEAVVACMNCYFHIFVTFRRLRLLAGLCAWWDVAGWVAEKPATLQSV